MVTKAEMISEPEEQWHIMAIDCCEHTLALLRSTLSSHLTLIQTRGNATNLDRDSGIDFIVIGVPHYPVRRPFISKIRELYPDVPFLILRRAEGISSTEDIIRGEFLLSDRGSEHDLQIVQAIRGLLPVKPCDHIHKGYNYETVRDVMRFLSENYADFDLGLEKVAKSLPISPVQLSRILNQEVGVSFRRLLRQTRIEEAKHLLASQQYSVKEVALRVGFADSHYFSRTFKALTGQSASEYRLRDAVFAE
jgi:AraC-like DNA-binding protein